MNAHYTLSTLRPDLNENQREAVIDSLIASGMPDDRLFHDALGREAQKLFPLCPSVAFLSKHPHDTRWLSIKYPDDVVPTALLRDLVAVGWTWQPGMRKLVSYDPLLPVPSAPPFGGRVEVDIEAKGTGISGSWTPEESAAHMRRVRKVLRKHGFLRVPHNKLTLADLL